MARTVVTISKDNTASGEYDFVFRSRLYKPDATAVPVIYCHHATGLAATPYKSRAIATSETDQSIALMVESLTELGHPVISSDQAGGSSWSNDAAQTALTNSLTRVAAVAGCRNDRVLLLADSMGTTLALNWARSNLSKIAAMALLLPIPNLQHVHDVASPPLPANIETAYGGLSAYNTALATHNPALFTGSYTGIPMKLWYSTDDTTADQATATSFATAVGASTASLGAVGHTVPLSFDYTQVVTWLHARA